MNLIIEHSLPEATMVITIEVDVLELCNRTVAMIPTISPQTGFWRRESEENAEPNQYIQTKYVNFKIIFQHYFLQNDFPQAFSSSEVSYENIAFLIIKIINTRDMMIVTAH